MAAATSRIPALAETVYWYFNRWEQRPVTEEILPVVRGQLRMREGRDPELSAGRVDS